MECTQRLEFTQELYETHTERVCPEQIGFLGICGEKHPVLRGPNKIGRDPQTCSIVLNLNSVSRQHAVINVLSSKEYMLMDLDSANKTKLLNKTLQPYIPHRMKNGDTVQFGDIFGIFRLLEEDDELPMTQAIDIPETPAPARNVSKLNKIPTTVIPESPDVSDRDDSFINLSTKTETTRLSSGQFIKPFGKSISIQPISTPKADTSRNSSKRSISFVDNPNTSLNESHNSLNSNKNDIHEMDTQVPYPITNPVNESTDSIYTADTQAPPGFGASPSIHSLDTQIPTTEHLPQVRKINEQQHMHLDIYASNKDNDLGIFNADTQPFVCVKDKPVDKPKLPDVSPTSVNKSEEELLFDEIEEDCFMDFNSQPLLPQESPKPEISSLKADAKVEKENETNAPIDTVDIDLLPTQKVEELPVKDNSDKSKGNVKNSVARRTNRILSDDSTDCEDIEFLPTQKIAELPVNKESKEEIAAKSPNKRNNRIQSDSSTDCEDIIPPQKIKEKKDNKDEDLTDCEDDLVQIDLKKPKPVEVVDLEDIPTQIIDVDPDKVYKPALEDMDTQIIGVEENAAANLNNDDSFEDQPTQIVEEIIPNNTDAAKKSFEEIVSPFKIPLQSPIKVKSKEIPKIIPKPKILETISIDDDNYYNATQDILDDLCTQREDSPILSKGKNNEPPIDDDVVPCSVEDYKVGEKFANIDRELSPVKYSVSKSVKDQNVNKLSLSLSKQEMKNTKGTIDGDLPVDKLKKLPSDCSDVERTPKKVRSILFTDSDLPNSQEIKTNIHMNHSKMYVTDSSSESEPEVNTEYSQEVTPFVHRKKKTKPVAKIDLTKKFNAEKLPERIITRVRKPTSKFEDSLLAKKVSANILKPKFFTEQEDQIDQDIITENVKRLKNFEKSKSNKEIKSDSIAKADNNHNKTNELQINVDENKEIKNKNETEKNESKTENKSKDTKEKIRVKIEKPKKKETEAKSKSKEGISTRKSKEDSADVGKSKQNPTSKESKHTIDEKRNSKDRLNNTSEDKISTRSTRSRRKEKDSKPTTPENDKKEPTETKKKRPSRRREAPKESTSPEVEIRRSKRQAKVKENKSDSQTIQGPKSILKKSIHEQSTVYNVSSSSGESPRNLKRSLGDDSDVPSPKRTRSFVTSNTSNSINNTSLRATPARTLRTQHVLFTAFPSEEVKHKLEKLGAVIVTDVTQCSVVLTMQIKRTFKLLCAVGLGRPIVGPSWVQACVDTHMIVDPWLHLIKDEPAEKRFQFSLEKTLNGKRDFLKGYNVSSTPSVQPNASEMKLIVECSGGTWKEGGLNWVCVSSTKDQSLWPALRKRGASVVSTEFILGGVLRQKLDINTNKFP